MFNSLSIAVTEPLHYKIHNFTSEVFKKWNRHHVAIPSPECVKALLPPVEMAHIIYYALVRLENRATGQEFHSPDMPMELQFRELLHDGATFHCHSHLNSPNPGPSAASCEVCAWKSNLYGVVPLEASTIEYIVGRFMEDPFNTIVDAFKPRVTPKVSGEDIEEMKSRLDNSALCSQMSHTHV